MKGKDQRTKGKDGPVGYRYYVCPSCKCKVLAEELHHLFLEVISDSITTPQEYVIEEIGKMIEADLEELRKNLCEVEKKIKAEEDNLMSYKKFAIKESISEDVMLFNSKNPNFLAYLISKNNSEEMLIKYKRQYSNLEFLTKKLNLLIKDDNVIRTTVEELLTTKGWGKLSDLEKRHLVLMVVEKCDLTAPNKVKFKLKSLSPKTKKIMGIRK